MADLASVYDAAAQDAPEWDAWADVRRCHIQIDALFDDTLAAVSVAEDYTIGESVPPRPGGRTLQLRHARMGRIRRDRVVP